MRNVIITGANSGLGFETAKYIAKDSRYHVILACRNKEKAEQAKEKIVSETGNVQVETMTIDTSSLSSVRKFADEYLARNEKLYALVNNAGISSMGHHKEMTEDGFDIVFETNYLGHFLLVQLLLPVMDVKGKIYNVSSDMHNPPGGIKWPGVEKIAKTSLKQNYSYSKLCMIYLTHSLAAQLKDDDRKITVNAFNPGYMGNTNFMKVGKAGDAFVKHTMPERYGNLTTSSKALASLITEDQFSRFNNQYFDRGIHPIKSSDLSYSEENAQELWDASMKYTNLK